MHTHIYIQMHMYTCIHPTHTYVHTCIQTHMHTYNTHTHTHTHKIHTHTQNTHTHTKIHTHTTHIDTHTDPDTDINNQYKFKLSLASKWVYSEKLLGMVVKVNTQQQEYSCIAQNLRHKSCQENITSFGSKMDLQYMADFTN